MDSEGELSAAVVVYILEKMKKRKKNRKNAVLELNLGPREEMPLGFTTLLCTN